MLRAREVHSQCRCETGEQELQSVSSSFPTHCNDTVRGELCLAKCSPSSMTSKVFTPLDPIATCLANVRVSAGGTAKPLRARPRGSAESLLEVKQCHLGANDEECNQGGDHSCLSVDPNCRLTNDGHHDPALEAVPNVGNRSPP